MTAGLSGTSVLRVEDPHLLRGETSYVGNLDLDGALVAHYVTSTEAHALIDGIDTSEAVDMPGVVDVVTAADIDLDLMVGRFAEYPEQARRPFSQATGCCTSARPSLSSWPKPRHKPPMRSSTSMSTTTRSRRSSDSKRRLRTARSSIPMSGRTRSSSRPAAATANPTSPTAKLSSKPSS